jgi:peptidoglycan hydrolase CwlO-like protein/outer membrane murein-binding lipoprotein Lpp
MASRLGAILALALVCSSAALVVEQRPISKVITLLKDMVGEIEKEAKADENVKEEMDCWCETGLKDKTIAISDAQKKIALLTEEIQSMATESAKLNTEISNLNKEVAHNTEALEEQTTMRQKRLGEFTEDEKSTIASISQMDGAITTISGKHEGSFDRASEFKRTGSRSAFLQGEAEAPSVREGKMMEAIVAIQTQLRRHKSLFTTHQREVAAAFIASPEDMGLTKEAALLQQKTGYNPEHTSSSGPILGILKGMKDSFETNLAGAQRDETRDQADFEALKAAKDSEIEAGTNLAATKTEQLGNVDQRHAESEQDLKDTERTLAADSEYLGNLKEQCKNIDAEYFERTQMRQQESQAVSKALAFLNSDDANDLYARTFNSASASASFFQKKAQSSKRLVGARILSLAAKSQDSRISALAAKIMSSVPADQAGAFETKKEQTFDQIKQSIQDMIDKLVKEKEDAIAHKNFCVDELQANERNTDQQRNIKADSEAKIAELTDFIKKLNREEAELNENIAESRREMKRAQEDRERANTQFQKTIADQRATAKLLEGAMGMLKGFYDKAALVQSHSKQTQPAGAPPPPGFKKYGSNRMSGGVMGMMQQIIDDAKAMEAESIKDEEASMTEYETFVTDTNTGIVTMQKQIANKQQDRALAQSEKAQTNIELKSANTELEELMLANTDLHSQCDYELKNFNAKELARDAEIQGLKESVAVFSGKSFNMFVQA